MFHTQYGTVKVGYKDTWDDQKVYNNWSLQIYDRARNMKVDPVWLYKQQTRKSVRLQQFKSIIAGYEEFKTMEMENGQRTADRLDFTDMVQKFVDDGLVGKAKFNGQTQLSTDVEKLVRSGDLTALSVGFRPVDMNMNNEGGRNFTKQELLEISVVNVPANPDAVIHSIKSMDIKSHNLIKALIENNGSISISKSS